MKSITHKLIIGSIIVMAFSSMLPNILLLIVYGSADRQELKPSIILPLAIITVFWTLFLFNIFINRFIVARVKKINNATKEVINGNFDFSLEVVTKDELSDLARNFNQMVKELQSNEYLNKEFVRNFSHEIKTPLFSIKGYADLISDKNTTVTEMKQYAEIISKESERLSSLSKNMLLLSVVDSKNIIAKNDRFDISEQIRNVIQFMQVEWEKKELEFDLDLSKIVIESNKEFIYQVWYNLLSNAIKFSPNGGEIKIEVKTYEEDIQIEFTNSANMEQEVQNRVFDLFFVSEKSRTNQSSGVGLFLSKNIIEKLNGSISVVSLDGKVSFKVLLPKA